MKLLKRSVKYSPIKLIWIFVGILIALVTTVILVIFIFTNKSASPSADSKTNSAKSIVISLFAVTNEPVQKTKTPIPAFVSDYVIPPIEDGMMG